MPRFGGQDWSWGAKSSRGSGAPVPRGTYSVSACHGRVSRDGLHCAGLPLLPARARPRRHLLECPAKLAAEHFPAFFHNDFLKLLTLIVPHFSPHSPPPAAQTGLGAPGHPAVPRLQRRPRAAHLARAHRATTCGRPERAPLVPHRENFGRGTRDLPPVLLVP